MKDSGKTYLATSGDRASGVTAGIQGVLALMVLSLVGSGQDTRSDVSPGTVVKRLLLQSETVSLRIVTDGEITNLTPENVSVRVLIQVRGELLNQN